jgi:hypothetical protein
VSDERTARITINPLDDEGEPAPNHPTAPAGRDDNDDDDSDAFYDSARYQNEHFKS